MTRNATIEKLEDIFQDIFDDEELKIRNETTAKDIEDWDSLAHINLVVAIEKEFEIKFGLGELPGLENVGDMIDLIHQKTGVE